MQRFKDLVFSEEHHALSNLEGRLNEVSAASYLGEQLPKALAESHSCASKELIASLQQPLLDAVRQTAEEDRKGLSSALYPIIGPAIRLYFRELFRNRITSRIFGDFSALNQEKYEVDQILLIETESATLLHQVAWVTDKPLNTDISTEMLGAIQTCAETTLDGESLDGLEKRPAEPGQLFFEGQHVSVEAGQKTILAVTGSGTAPKRFRRKMREVIEAVESASEGSSESAPGGEVRDKASVPTLETLVIDNRSPDGEKRRRWPSRLAAGTLAIASTGLIAFNLYSEFTWQRSLNQLRAAPGIEVIGEGRSLFNSKSLRLLQDPLARDALDILLEEGEVPTGIALESIPYHSVDPGLVALREHDLREELNSLATRQEHLALAESVETSLGEQRASMSSAFELIDHLTRELFYERFDPTREKIEVRHDEEGWKISGTATHQQLELIRDMAADGRIFSGRAVDFTGLNDDTDERLLQLKREIDAISIHFEPGTAKVSSKGKGERVRLYKLIDQFEALHRATDRKAPRYIITASPVSGSGSRSRAEIAFDRIESELDQLRLFEYRTSDITTAPELDPGSGREGVWLTAEPTLAKD
ncbi:hypothetical protein VSU19_19070 [Verrucomicrobiales bacterium BCK34]|nr:hypothetical protein [Verrucomicrobiales bacterium BCK34]